MVWERPVEVARPRYRFAAGHRAYRRHLAWVGAALLPLVIFLVPTLELFFLGVVWFSTRSSDLSARLGPALGILIAVVIVAYAANWFALLGNRGFERRLRAILEEETGREGGDFVSVSVPSATSFYPRYSEGHADVGVLYQDEDALVFECLRERLEVPRTDLLDVSLTMNWQFVQLGARWCVITHRTRDGEREGRAELRVHTRSAATVRRNVHATRALAARLRGWWGFS